MSRNDGENRKIPGDRLVSRILTRVRRRPRMGLSPDFYARFGMSDPWSAPEFGGEEPAATEGFVFLSAQPYYAMMRRLAASRRRRERREAAFQARHSGGTLRAAKRQWPGETAASLATSRIARLALDEMTLPPSAAPAPVAPVVVPQGAPSLSGPVPRAGSTFTQRGANAWWSTPFVPARVFGGASEPEAVDAPTAATGSRVSSPSPGRRATAASHAGARLANASLHGGSAARTIAEALPPTLGARQRQLSRVIAAIETLPAEEQQVQLRRVVRRMGVSAPIVRTVFDEIATTSVPGRTGVARPSQVAARRADPTATVGLRPVLARSPAMALASSAEVDRAANGTLATAERSAERAGGASASLSRLPRRAAAAQRALARGADVPMAGLSAVPAPLAYARAVSTAALSASPVLRLPAAVAGVRAPGHAPTSGAFAAAEPPMGSAAARASARAVTASGAVARRLDPASRLDLASGSTETASTPSGVRLQASARAVARFVASAGGMSLPEAAQGAVRTTEGTWVAARDVAPAQRDPASPPSQRTTHATAHAAARVDAGHVEGRSVLPRAMPATDRVLATPSSAAPSVVAALSASPVARAPRSAPVAADGSGSALVRTPRGAWVAARSSEGRAATTEAARASSVDRAHARVGSAALPQPVASSGAPRADGAAPSRPVGARALPTSAFRTAEPLRAGTPGAAGPVAEASGSRPVSTSPALGGRLSGVVHAAGRADSPASSPARPAPVPASPDVAAAPAPRVPGVRASVVRAPAMAHASAVAHASARTDLPAEGATLQPRVSPSVRAVRPVTVSQPGVSQPRMSRPGAPRSATVAAAARVLSSPVFSAAGARALASADAAGVAPVGAAPSRFARSGPLSFALPPLASGLSASSPTARTIQADPSAPTTRAAARTRERATRVYTTPASAYSPSSAVTTPSGVWISARTAAATPGLRILRTEGGRLVALAPAPTASAVGSSTRAAATAGASFARPFHAPADDGADALVAPPPAPRRRAAEWAGERQRVGEATAYRGAFRTPDTVGAGASVHTTPEGEFEGARVTRTPARRDRPRRLAATAGEMSLPSPAMASTATGGGSVAGTASRSASRQPLEERLHGVAVGAPDRAAPSWAVRSDGAPQVRSPGGLFEALARATSTEEIVRVIYSRADGVRETPLAKEAPVVQVIEQIRQEVRREQAATETATRASRLDAPSTTTIRGGYVQPVKSTTRVNRGGVRGVGATTRSVAAGSGDDRIMKLVKKLQGLIHLAEAEGRLADARSQVRMAEDSASARAEGQGPVGTTKDGGERGQKQDIDALGREVLEVVTRELEFRRSRRTEDHDESIWW